MDQKRDTKPLSDQVEQAFEYLRRDFHATESRGLEAALRRVRQESELRTRLGATLRTRPGSMWSPKARAALATAASIAIVVLGSLPLISELRRSAPQEFAPWAASESIPSDAVVSRIAKAQPGEIVRLSESVSISAGDETLVFAKKVRVEIATNWTD